MKTNTRKFYQFIKKPLMGKLVFSFLFLFFSFKQGDCSEIQKPPVVRKELKVDNTFQNIRIEGDISVILTNGPAGTVFIEGREKELNKIKPVFENNVLVIDGNSKQLFTKFTLYLSAITLQTIQLNGDGTISSIDFIQSDNLHISLNGDIKVKVKTMGHLSFDTAEDIELVRK